MNYRKLFIVLACWTIVVMIIVTFTHRSMQILSQQGRSNLSNFMPHIDYKSEDLTDGEIQSQIFSPPDNARSSQSKEQHKRQKNEELATPEQTAIKVVVNGEENLGGEKITSNITDVQIELGNSATLVKLTQKTKLVEEQVEQRENISSNLTDGPNHLQKLTETNKGHTATIELPRFLSRSYMYTQNVTKSSSKELNLSEPHLTKIRMGQEYFTSSEKSRNEPVRNESWPAYFRESFVHWQRSSSWQETRIGQDYLWDPNKYFIYRCDRGALFHCGGWADRLDGILTAYLIANLTGRVFKIDIQNPPCSFTRYLVPNAVNWSLPYPFHKDLRIRDNTFRVLDAMRRLNFRELLTRNGIKAIHPSVRYYYFKANVFPLGIFRRTEFYYKELAWMQNLTKYQTSAMLFKRLFKLSPRLYGNMTSFLDRAVPTSRHKLICAHVRMGRNPSNPWDTVIRTTNHDLIGIWKFLAQFVKSDLDSVFVMSDAAHVLSDAKKQIFGKNLYVIEGDIIHIDRSTHLNVSTQCDGVEKVIFEQHILMNCNVLVLGRSGLGRYAAMVRGSPNDAFCYLSVQEVKMVVTATDLVVTLFPCPGYEKLTRCLTNSNDR